MRRTILVVLGLVSALGAACNYDTGECYPRGQDGSGAGGGVILQGGAGGFGDAPSPKPQGAPNSADPCAAGPTNAECLVNWKQTCSAEGTGSDCIHTTTVYRCDHLSLNDAKIACEKALNVGTASGPLSCGPCQWTTNATDDCYDKCDKKADEEHKLCDGMPDGPGKAKCRQAAEEHRGDCYRDCNKKG